MTLILVDSRDRLSGSISTSQFNIKLSNLVQGVTAAKLKEVGINHKIWNISTEYNNNSFTYKESSDVTFTIANGFYTPDNLASHIQNGLNSTSSSGYIYSVTYSPVTFKYTISCTGNFIIEDCTLGNLMGFSTETIAGTSTTSDFVVTFDDPAYLLLDVSCFGTNVQLTSGQQTSFIISNDTRTTEYNGLSNQCFQFSTPVDMLSFSVCLRNKDGSIVNLNNTNFYFILEVTQ